MFSFICHCLGHCVLLCLHLLALSFAPSLLLLTIPLHVIYWVLTLCSKQSRRNAIAVDSWLSGK